MYQEDYFNLYKRLIGFAERRAKRYFTDSSLIQDAVFEAMDRFVDEAKFTQLRDELIPSPEILDLNAWGRTVITNSLKNSSKKKRDYVAVRQDL
jgi:hypothetical protein